MEFVQQIVVFIIISITRNSQGQSLNTDSNVTKPHYNIATYINPPWVIKEDSNGNSTELNGFIVDLVKLLAEDIGFDYTFVISPENSVGSPRFSDGSWDGIIGQVIDMKANVAAGAIEITDLRRQVVDFTSPFLISKKNIVIQKPKPHHKSLLFLLEPMDYVVWILVLIVNLAVGGLLYLINKFSPSEWSQVPADQDPTGARDSFSPQNSFFFVHSTICWQGYKELPRSPAGRVVTASWFSFCMLIIIAYTASFAAMVIANNSQPAKPVIPFKTFQQMLSQTEVKYGLIGSRRILSEMQNSNDEMVRNIYSSMDLSLISSSGENGLNKIRNSDGKYAGIIDIIDAQIHAPRDNCDMLMVGEGILLEKYGLACEKGSSICNLLSQSVLSLRENGDIHKIYTQWLQNKQCPNTNSNSYISAQEVTLLNHRPLSVAETALAWIILLIGLILGPLLLLLEICLAKRQNNKSRTPQKERSTSRNAAEEEIDDNAGDMGEKAPIAAGEP